MAAMAGCDSGHAGEPRFDWRTNPAVPIDGPAAVPGVSSEVRMPTFIDRINSRTATIGIIGQGYVGLPLGLVFEEAGFPVLGLRRRLEEGRRAEPRRVATSSTSAPTASTAAVARGRFVATTDFDGLRECDAILICVPDAARQAPRARPVVRPQHRARHRAAPAPRPARRPRVDDLPGHDRRGGAADPRGDRAEVPRRLPARLLARARGPGQPAVQHQDDPEGRRRREPRRPPRRPSPSTRRPSTRSSRSRRRASPSRASCSRTSTARSTSRSSTS